MKLLKKLLLPLLCIAVVFSICSCGEDGDTDKGNDGAVNIVSATVDVGELIFKMSDGSTVRAGKFPDNSEGVRIAGAKIESDGALYVTLSNGVTKKCSAIPTFTKSYVLNAASITDAGVLLLHTSEGKVSLGNLLYLSAPTSPLTPSGASEYASRDVTGRNTATVEIKVKGFGTITLLLDATTAPVTVENFLSLVRSGFYDGLTFHRVMSDFMIQGGDPNGDGTGNSDKTIYGEFSTNGYKDNDLSHKKGVISMARKSYPNDSASCQFFICNADASESLDGKYAAFGYVLNGLNVVDAITEYTVPFTDAYSGTIEDKSKQAVIEKITITDDLEVTTVSHATVNGEGELVLKLSNGTALPPVAVPENPEQLAFKSATLSGSRLKLSINDGYAVNSAVIPVIYGDTTGAVASINFECHLIITVGETKYDLGKVYYPTVPAEEMTPEGASDLAVRDLEGRNYAIVEIKFRGYGKVSVLLDATAAPKTVSNFLKLTKSGYYNGLKIHGAISGIMMEGGIGEGELEPIFGEFSKNGYSGNDLSHKRGVISMAVGSEPDSATSGFFICATDLSEYFDGSSAAFGYVTDGMNIVDEIIKLTSGYASSSTGVISDEEKMAVIESVTVVRDLDTPIQDS